MKAKYLLAIAASLFTIVFLIVAANAIGEPDRDGNYDIIQDVYDRVDHKHVGTRAAHPPNMEESDRLYVTAIRRDAERSGKYDPTGFGNCMQTNIKNKQEPHANR